MSRSDDARRVLGVLRDGRGHHIPGIAEELELAPFAVRGHLQALKSDRLVEMKIEREAALWYLTTHGFRVVYSGNQLELGGRV